MTDFAPLTIVVDTREQSPLTFDPLKASTVRGCVPVFDYGLQGDAHRFAVERKSLADFVASFASHRRQFAELQKIRRARAAGFPSVHYVVAGRWADLEAPGTYAFSTRANPGLMRRRWAELVYRDGVTVTWAGDEAGAALAVLGLLRARAEYLQEEC